MNKSVNTSKPVFFHDDRSKDLSVWRLSSVLFEDKNICLCVAKSGRSREKVLFSRHNGEVLSINFEFWYATNKMPV
jgi:hypothetical protein